MKSISYPSVKSPGPLHRSLALLVAVAASAGILTSCVPGATGSVWVSGDSDGYYPSTSVSLGLSGPLYTGYWPGSGLWGSGPVWNGPGWNGGPGWNRPSVLPPAVGPTIRPVFGPGPAFSPSPGRPGPG